MLETPVALFIFNRPEETARTFDAIRGARPRKLFIIADGPRYPEEIPLCEATRAVTEHIDWSCEVKRNYTPINMGCDPRVSSGISWVFMHVDRAIFLEDDCVADGSFFTFCQELLDRYTNDTRILLIGGTSCQEKNPDYKATASYYFSMMSMGWGAYGTWRRAWSQYDWDMKRWPSLRDSGELKRIFDNPAAYERFARVWDEYYEEKIHHTWDGPWSFVQAINGGLCANPVINLVENIGFNERASHQKVNHPGWVDLPSKHMTFPLVHPSTVTRDRAAENFDFLFFFGIDKTSWQRMIRPIKNRFPTLHHFAKALRTKIRTVLLARKEKNQS